MKGREVCMGIQSKDALPAQKAIEEKPIALNENISKGSESKNPMWLLRNVGRIAKNTFTNPKMQIYGAAGMAAAGCTLAILLKEPNISGVIGGIVTGVEGLPQALLSFQRIINSSNFIFSSQGCACSLFNESPL